MVIRVGPTPIRFQTIILSTPVDSTPLHPIPNVWCPRGWKEELSSMLLLSASGSESHASSTSLEPIYLHCDWTLAFLKSTTYPILMQQQGHFLFDFMFRMLSYYLDNCIISALRCTASFIPQRKDALVCFMPNIWRPPHICLLLKPSKPSATGFSIILAIVNSQT